MALTRAMPSDAEIAVLEALAAQAEVLSTTPGAGVPAFGARILHVDPARKFLILGRSGNFTADAALAMLQGAELRVEWGEWRIAFHIDGPAHCIHEGSGAIRTRFPESVSINRRRLHERAAVPADAPARCVAYSGATAIFDAVVTDVSKGGLGLQLDSSENALEPGMVLPRCRIERAGRKPVIVDLEVRHTSTATLADGSRATRAGCRFVNLSPEAEGLVAELLPA